MFNKLLGNAVKMDSGKATKKLSMLLIENEIINLAFKVIRDMLVFTNFRIILIDRTGVTGKKTEYLSIPYKSITRYAVESAGHIDLDIELKIWVVGMEEPISKEIKNGKEILYDLQKGLTRYTSEAN